MKYYWFTFADGYSVCVRGFSKQELRVEENKHDDILGNRHRFEGDFCSYGERK